MNVIFYGLVAVATLFAVINGTPAEVGDAALKSAKASVELAIGLVGYIALFLGLMEVVKEGGGLQMMARIIRPLMVRLFPDVPPDHPAMGAMIMNIAANALGLGNAATPFGLKAMQELDQLNTRKGTATNAMVLFLAINTSGLALLPTGIIGLRDQLGSADAAVIFPTTLMATAMSTVAGVLAAKLLGRLPVFGESPPPSEESRRAIARGAPTSPVELLPLLGFLGLLVALVVAVYRGGPSASAWIMPGLVFGMLSFGVARGVKVYEVFVRGAREGFNLALLIIPYLVAILSAMGMLRASGGLEWITGLLGTVTEPLGLPAEVLPLALLRPLSGSGAFGITADLLKTFGPDSYIGNLASTMNGSTETTFYVLAVYFGSVGVSRIRHAVLAGLAADLMGVIGSVLAVRLLLGGG
ncbi:MAG: spore maturation protein [Deltaproteobacteria bacterium]|nr:MAG: spore maturation protein [Deltaproteobacteria bacterium]